MCAESGFRGHIDGYYIAATHESIKPRFLIARMRREARKDFESNDDDSSDDKTDDPTETMVRAQVLNAESGYESDWTTELAPTVVTGLAPKRANDVSPRELGSAAQQREAFYGMFRDMPHERMRHASGRQPRQTATASRRYVEYLEDKALLPHPLLLPSGLAGSSSNEIMLSYSGLTDERVSVVADALRLMPYAEALLLRNNRIGTKGCLAIARALTNSDKAIDRAVELEALERPANFSFHFHEIDLSEPRRPHPPHHDDEVTPSTPRR